MFGWLTKRSKPEPGPALKPRSVDDALALLAAVKGKFRKGGPDAVIVHAEGLAKVAGIVAGRLGAEISDVVGANLTVDQMHMATEVLVEVAADAKPKLDTSIEKARMAAQGVAAGCLMLAEMYRLRLLAEESEDRQKVAAERAGLQYRSFLIHLAEVADGSRDSMTMI